MQILRTGGCTGRYCGRASAVAQFPCTVLVTTVHLGQFDTFSNVSKTASMPYGLRLPACFIPLIKLFHLLKGAKYTTDISKSFSERACEAIPKGRRECVGVAEKSLVQSDSEGSEASPLPTKPFLIFKLTEEQAGHLRFAALCQAEDLEKGYEANEAEVQEAICSLNESMLILAQGEST